jgi:hypothetical protein
MIRGSIKWRGRDHLLVSPRWPTALSIATMKRLRVAPIFALAISTLVIDQGHAQSATSSTNLTPNAPAAVMIGPSATDMISVPAPATPSFTTDTARSGAAPASDPAGTGGAASGSATGGNSPFNPDCAIAGSDDPANLSFDTVGCGQ